MAFGSSMNIIQSGGKLFGDSDMIKQQGILKNPPKAGPEQVGPCTVEQPRSPEPPNYVERPPNAMLKMYREPRSMIGGSKPRTVSSEIFCAYTEKPHGNVKAESNENGLAPLDLGACLPSQPQPVTQVAEMLSTASLCGWACRVGVYRFVSRLSR